MFYKQFAPSLLPGCKPTIYNLSGSQMYKTPCMFTGHWVLEDLRAAKCCTLKAVYTVRNLMIRSIPMSTRPQVRLHICIVHVIMRNLTILHNWWPTESTGPAGWYQAKLPFDGEFDTSNVGRTPNAASDAQYPVNVKKWGGIPGTDRSSSDAYSTCIRHNLPHVMLKYRIDLLD